MSDSRNKQGPSDLNELSKQIGLGGSSSANDGLQSLGSIFSSKRSKAQKQVDQNSVAAQLSQAPSTRATPPQQQRTYASSTATTRPPTRLPQTTPPANAAGMWQQAQRRKWGAKRIVWTVVILWIAASVVVGGIQNAVDSVKKKTSSPALANGKKVSPEIASRLVVIDRRFGTARIKQQIRSLRHVIPAGADVRDVTFLGQGRAYATAVRHGKAAVYTVGSKHGKSTALTQYIRGSASIHLSSIDASAPSRLLAAAEIKFPDHDAVGWSGVTLESDSGTPPSLAWVAARESDPVVYFDGNESGGQVRRSAS